MTQDQMAKIDSFLGDAGVFYLATADGDQPRLRPLGLHLHLDGKLLISVGDFKNVYRLMKANPRVELVALAKDFRWLRVTAEVVEEAADDSARYQELALQAEPGSARSTTTRPGTGWPSSAWRRRPRSSTA